MSLDEVGRAQADLAAQALSRQRPTKLWSSDLARARETAEGIAVRTGLTVATSAAFREYSVGRRTGLTLVEFAERHPEEYAEWRAGRRAVLDAEDDDDVVARFVPALTTAMSSLGPGERGVVVSHGAALRTALVEVLGWPRSSKDGLVGLGNCHWAELEESSSAFLGGDLRWRLRGYNLFAAPGPDFVSPEPVG